MSHRDRTYVIFDGDHDIWAYGYMKGWKANDRVDFDFVDAHDLAPLTARAENETYIKNRLRERLEKSTQVVVLIGENTRNLYKFVRWEIELALALDLPIVAVNLNGQRRLDEDRCPPLLRPADAVHVSFNLAIIRQALDHFPTERQARRRGEGGPRHFGEDVYSRLGL